jgi:hypothetical protein
MLTIRRILDNFGFSEPGHIASLANVAANMTKMKNPMIADTASRWET